MAKQTPVIDYDKIAAMASFQQLGRKKNRFLWSMTAFFFTAYILLPILTSYTELLHQKAVGDMPWVWLYAAGLFVMTWSFAHIYVRKASAYDEMARKIMEEYESEVGK